MSNAVLVRTPPISQGDVDRSLRYDVQGLAPPPNCPPHMHHNGDCFIAWIARLTAGLYHHSRIKKQCTRILLYYLSISDAYEWIFSSQRVESSVALMPGYLVGICEQLISLIVLSIDCFLLNSFEYSGGDR